MYQSIRTPKCSNFNLAGIVQAFLLYLRKEKMTKSASSSITSPYILLLATISISICCLWFTVYKLPEFNVYRQLEVNTSGGYIGPWQMSMLCIAMINLSNTLPDYCLNKALSPIAWPSYKHTWNQKKYRYYREWNRRICKKKKKIQVRQ